MRRTPIQRSRVRIGRRARARIAASGPLAKGRPALSREAWNDVKLIVWMRARARCEVCGGRGRDVDHIVPRGQGGADADTNLCLLCRPCHERKDWPYQRGRLIISGRSGDRLHWAIVKAESKFTARALGLA